MGSTGFGLLLLPIVVEEADILVVVVLRDVNAIPCLFVFVFVQADTAVVVADERKNKTINDAAATVVAVAVVAAKRIVFPAVLLLYYLQRNLSLSLSLSLAYYQCYKLEPLE
jgi:hypothetical protein